MAGAGPVAKIDAAGNWPQALAAVPPPAGLYDWKLAVVLSTDAKIAKIGLGDGSEGQIPLAELTWARHVDPDQPQYGRGDRASRAMRWRWAM